jgi:signal transduction histidine kinase
VEVDSSPIRTGERRLLFSILHDVTERERNRERLEQQNEQLELLNRVVRHDIRNDMSVIIGHADMLNDHVDDDGQRFLDTLQEHSEHIVELTKTARELMEAMLGDGDSDPGSIDVGRLLQQEVDDVAAGYEPAEFTVEGSLPNVRVQGNEILSSAFRNLLTNAVQHNDDEVPQVTVTVEDRPDTVEVRVADNGPGVPDGQKEEIFGKGEHGIDSSGTGLGLYLVHTFVDQFGGDVWVTDNDPEGAVFHVELPKSSSR